MAKIQGLVGGISGKMGNAIFRQRKGQTIVAQYQPVVSNPNTPAQQNARAAFKLITQLSTIMAPAMVGFATLGVATRPARQKGGKSGRNIFVQKNYPLISIDPSPEAAERVTISMEEIQLTDSFRPLTELVNNSVAGSLSVAAENLAADVASVRFVVVEYLQIAGGSQAAIRTIVDEPVYDRAAELQISATNSEKLTVLAYGLIPSAATRASVDFENIHTPADEDFISAVDLERMVREGEMSVTMTTGINVTIPSA